MVMFRAQHAPAPSPSETSSRKEYPTMRIPRRAIAVHFGLAPTASDVEINAEAERRVRVNAELAPKAVDVAIAEGKVLRTQRAWALDYAGRDPAGFSAFARVAPVQSIATETDEVRLLTASRARADNTSIVDAQRAIARDHPDLVRAERATQSRRLDDIQAVRHAASGALAVFTRAVMARDGTDVAAAQHTALEEHPALAREYHSGVRSLTNAQEER